MVAVSFISGGNGSIVSKPPNFRKSLITIKVVSSNPIHGEVYSIQHYVIMFVGDLQKVGGFLWVLRFPLRFFKCFR
jgi:hypothetical protein